MKDATFDIFPKKGGDGVKYVLLFFLVSLKTQELKLLFVSPTDKAWSPLFPKFLIYRKLQPNGKWKLKLPDKNVFKLWHSLPCSNIDPFLFRIKTISICRALFSGYIKSNVCLNGRVLAPFILCSVPRRKRRRRPGSVCRPLPPINIRPFPPPLTNEGLDGMLQSAEAEFAWWPGPTWSVWGGGLPGTKAMLAHAKKAKKVKLI